MHALVTGAAGFIGSHLSEALLAGGWSVRGVDAFTTAYDTDVKHRNARDLVSHPAFDLVKADLRTTELEPLLDGVDVVYHLAGQPGVRPSWASGFRPYVEHNVVATQRLLEAAKDRPGLRRFVYASSSSVYGNAVRYPTRESDPTHPHSPYGVTKLAGEQMCAVYGSNCDVPTTMLRFFTVYGPRQRPDMGIHRFVAAALLGMPLPVYGDGSQVRDFTFVADVVAAVLRAGECDLPPGTVVNVAGGGSITVNELVDLVEREVGTEIAIRRLPVQPGDVDATSGSIELAAELLGWRPRVSIEHGVAAQVAWQRQGAHVIVPAPRTAAVAAVLG
jgi:nucleoside-diphosphate-sugar epimerase